MCETFENIAYYVCEYFVKKREYTFLEEAQGRERPRYKRGDHDFKVCKWRFGSFFVYFPLSHWEKTRFLSTVRKEMLCITQSTWEWTPKHWGHSENRNSLVNGPLVSTTQQIHRKQGGKRRLTKIPAKSNLRESWAGNLKFSSLYNNLTACQWQTNSALC